MTKSLTEPQRRMLRTVPDELTRVQTHWGFKSVLGNQTLRVLRDRGLVRLELVPPRWCRTDAGRAALNGEEPRR